MKKEEMKAFEHVMKCLEKEWERTGKVYHMGEFAKDEIITLYEGILEEVKERNLTFERMEEIPFEDSLEYSHQHYILLRLGRKVEKAIADMQKKGSYFTKVFMDKEETKMYEYLSEIME